MVRSGQVLDSWTACLRSFSALIRMSAAFLRSALDSMISVPLIVPRVVSCAAAIEGDSRRHAAAIADAAARSVVRLDVDQRAVRISELKVAQRTFPQQCQARRAFGIEVDGFGLEADVGLCDLVEMCLEGIELGYAKTDVIHCRLFDAGAVEGGNLPRHDCHGDAAISEVVTTVFGRNVAGFELEHVGVEIGDALRLARAQRE